MVFDILRHPEQNAPKWWFGAATAGMLAFILLYRFPMGLMTYGYKDSRGMFLGAVVFACICLPLYRYDETLSRNAVVKILATIGIFSYSLYLTHFYFIGIFNQAFKMLHVNGVALYGRSGLDNHCGGHYGAYFSSVFRASIYEVSPAFAAN